jgi:hypothetical protein
MATGTYQQSGPSSPQQARKVDAAIGGQVKGFGDVPASLVNNGLRVQARASGASSVTVAFTADGANTALSVTVATNAITVHLATNAANAPTSTAAEVRNAINTTTAASALVSAQVVSGDGSQVTPVLGTTALTGNTSVSQGTRSTAPTPKQHAVKNSYA